MAIFLTPKTNESMTPGERKFAGLLDLYLNDDYLIWYDVPSQGIKKRYPDFLIFNPHLGLICLEVKDWRYHQFDKVTKTEVYVRFSGQRTKCTHPIEQARQTLLPFITQMQKDRNLCTKDSKLKFIYAHGAVMVNLKRSDIDMIHGDQFKQCFPDEQTFYAEDFSKSKEEFENFIKGLIPYQSHHKLTAEDIDRIRAHIFPELIINSESIYDEDGNLIFHKNLKIMDLKQENLARTLGNGHRIIHGVAGSGKTMILQYRALDLAKQLNTTQDKSSTILVICYNKTLASILRARLLRQDDHHLIEVYHFYDWLKAMKKQYNIQFPYNKDTYLEDLPHHVCDYILHHHEEEGFQKYHAVLIDEGHDLEALWLKALTVMTQDSLLLLYDDAQNIYGRKKGIGFTLSSVGINARGRTKILNINYRNSSEIQHFSTEFLESFISIDENNNEESIPVIHSKGTGFRFGHEPQLQFMLNTQQENNFILGKIQKWQQQNIPLSEIAILAYGKYQFKDIIACFEANNIPYIDLSNENNRNSTYQNQVVLCTLHSSKGLEFKKVIIRGLESIRTHAHVNMEQIARVLYIGMTRAQEELYMISTQENEWTSAIFKALQS